MITKRFIKKDGASNYYMVNEGAGGFLNPPNHPEHNWSIQEFRGGHEFGFYSLSGVLDDKWIPSLVKIAARIKLERWSKENSTLVPDENWIASVYNYFRYCYSLDGVNKNASDCVIDHSNNTSPELHLAYLFVKQYYPNHEPRLDLIANDPGYGGWSKGKKDESEEEDDTD